jgi:hypothetical protein
MSTDLTRIWIDPDLEIELKWLRDTYEQKRGRKIEGGVPAASKLAAKILKKYRMKQGGKIEVVAEKKNGTQKDTLFIMD